MAPSETSMVPPSHPPTRETVDSTASTSKLSSPVNYGTKPLARAVLVCKRCRSKKIKCDQVFPACGSCIKANEPCVGIDSATGREVSRSYIVDLEHQVQELRRQNLELERQLHAFAGEITVEHSETQKSKSESKQKRSIPPDLHSGSSVQHANTAADSDSVRAIRPFLNRTSSCASGLSPARLLCQAIQQSAQAGINVRSAAKQSSTTNGRAIPSKTNCNDAQDLLAPSVEQRKSGPATSRTETSSATLDSRSITPLDGSKRGSPSDDTDLMQYATATETSDITVPAPEQLAEPSPLPAPFPPLSTARKLVDAYFERVNPQLPILERSSFMPRFERACQVGLEKAKAKLSRTALQQAEENEDHVELEPNSADGHLFHLVFAIAAAMGWTRSKWSAENHHEAAMRYLDPRRSTGPDNLGAIMGRDALEQLQCLLLTALYSIMRPMKPGVWYCLGVALRLTTGLGLYTESPGLLEATSSESAENILEKKRRLFWCSYALDRQVCVHLGRPFGIADTDIKVKLPWADTEGDRMDDSASQASTDDAIELARREAASTLAALQGTADKRRRLSASAMTRPKDASRWIPLSFFRMRILQSEIQQILYQNAELPRRFQSHEHWKNDVLDRLRLWRQFAPSSKEELEANGCGYNPIFLELNYQQTLLMVYGLSPRFPNATRADLSCVETCSCSIISIYATLSKEGQMNYTWMTGHNVFLACTSYLYAIWQINAADPASFRDTLRLGFANKVEEIQHFAKACDKILASLQWATAEKCRKCLRAMFYATSMVVGKLDRSASSKSSAAKVRKTSRGAPKATSRSFYDSASEITGHSALASPSVANVSSAPSRGWSNAVEPIQGSQATPESGVAHRSVPTGFEPELHTAIHSDEARHLDIAPGPSHLHYGTEATTPSRGLNHYAPPAEIHGWNGPDAQVSPRNFLPDSPSNFDISSLMAASAMELDALFQEAGLSAGPNARESTNFADTSHSSGQRAWPTDGITRLVNPGHTQHAAPLSFSSSDGPPSMPVYTVSNTGFAGSHQSTMSTDADWEAMGFGYRHGESAVHQGQHPLVPALPTDTATEFDYRFLDAHMGF